MDFSKLSDQFYSMNMKDSSTQTQSAENSKSGGTQPVASDWMNKQDKNEIVTSDVYETKNLPWRFENPAKWDYSKANLAPTEKSDDAQDKEIEQPPEAPWLKSYTQKKSNILYRTTNMDYGSIPPNVHTVPVTFFPMEGKFTEDLNRSGMYRNRALNTALDKSKI